MKPIVGFTFKSCHLSFTFHQPTLNFVLTTTQLGQKGEALAAQILQAKGYEIIHQNYRAGRAEIDLIARKDDWILFVEVKTRTNLSYGYPESFVSPKKIERIKKAADQFVYETNWRGNIRFDVIAISMSRTKTEIEHFEDAL
ncbi:YraN family protein [Siphonobacter sp. SORGH_AS_0500]|uniref:YraN family protein n=1 Tax=Siphonobacter sp. SORGH_AS_0500 TaxID=1864824 RepID=UPI000CBB183B|nr:YraN family protein [Siphonobacter sp. SORGH_AS_0500]MDR6193397.1 putative endonuclease [Siphonobacter sp. SORGH_AS_0500]PKK34725.1 YraN family protein [Siphonobacter sp. SORGH_AS_0500]